MMEINKYISGSSAKIDNIESDTQLGLKYKQPGLHYCWLKRLGSEIGARPTLINHTHWIKMQNQFFMNALCLKDKDIFILKDLTKEDRNKWKNLWL